MNHESREDPRTCLFLAVAAYTAWGVLPVYWKLLKHVPATEVLAHRILWSCLFLGVTIVMRREWSVVRRLVTAPRTLAVLCITGILIGLNWLIYIWAVNEGRLVEASLGYFMLPLFNVLFGRVFFRERLRVLQAVAVAFAGAGVISMLFLKVDEMPWIAIGLALTFGFYGVLRKRFDIPSVQGLLVELIALFVPAAVYILRGAADGSGHLLESPSSFLLLALSGPVTALPLLWFVRGARGIPLKTLGFVQYLAPTLQMFIGVAVYGESVPGSQWLCFIAVWIALAVYSFDAVLSGWRERRGAELLRAKEAV